MIRRYVFTGGACTGKTTLVAAFAEKNFQTVPETATILLNETRKLRGLTRDAPKMKAGTTAFYERLLQRQLRAEKVLKNDGTSAFLDCGCIDTFAYCRFLNIPLPTRAIEIARTNRYSGVFLLEPLPCFENQSNKVRWYTKKDALTIHRLAKESYEEFGYTPIIIPPTPIEERVNLVLSSINKQFEEKNRENPNTL